MLRFKGCPRCHGDFSANSDVYGWYWECLQCGHMVDVEEPQRLASAVDKRREMDVPGKKAA